MTNTTIDWVKIQHIMERSIRGTRPNEEELDELDDAWKLEPDKYKQIHAEVREAAHAEMKKWG